MECVAALHGRGHWGGGNVQGPGVCQLQQIGSEQETTSLLAAFWCMRM